MAGIIFQIWVAGEVGAMFCHTHEYGNYIVYAVY